MRPSRTAAAGICLLAVLTLSGCRLFGAARPPAPPTAEITPQQQMRFAQAESRLGSPDARDRLQAAVALLSMDHPEGLEAVLRRMRSAEDPQVRVSMIRAAAFTEDPRTFDAILGQMEAPNPEVRRAAAHALARFTGEEQVQAVMQKADEADPERRRLLYEALGQGLALRAVPVLIEGLGAEQEEVRSAAVEALRRISDRDLGAEPQRWREWWKVNRYKSRKDVLEEHLRGMSNRLEASRQELQSLKEQQDQLMRLISTPQEETPEKLIRALSSAHGAVRRYAAFRLASLPTDRPSGRRIDEKTLYRALARALDDDSVEVRQNVLQFVLRVEGDYRDQLIEKALQDEEPDVLSLAVGAVSEQMGEEVVARLEELLRTSPHAEVREAAANMLGKIGSEESVPALTAALDDEAANVRWFAIEGLRKLGAVEAMPRISQMLDEDEDPRVREIAATTLGELGQPGGVPALRRALRDPRERVRQKAAAALIMLARDSYERMMVIAGALREEGLHAEAREVLNRVIETYREKEGMHEQVVRAYRALGQVQRTQQDYAAAAQTYQQLDEFANGELETRRKVLTNWLDAGQPARAVAALEAWFAVPETPVGTDMLQVGLEAAERMFREGNEQEGGAVVELVAEAAGEEVPPDLQVRITRLQRRADGE